MRGLLQIGRSLALRRLPRLGAAGGSLGVVSLPGFSGRPAGYGPGRSVARGLSARCLGTSLSWRYLTALVCRWMAVPARGDTESLRPACRVQRRGPSRRLPKAPGAALSRTAWGRVQAPLVGVQPTPVPSAPSRGAGKAAASSRCALQPRRASVVTTAKLGSDDAVRRRIDNSETRVVSGFPPTGAEQRKSAGKCRGAKRGFFASGKKKYDPDVRPCTQGGIGCPVSGARVRFATRLVGDCPVG